MVHSHICSYYSVGIDISTHNKCLFRWSMWLPRNTVFVSIEIKNKISLSATQIPTTVPWPFHAMVIIMDPYCTISKVGHCCLTSASDCGYGNTEATNSIWLLYSKLVGSITSRIKMYVQILILFQELHWTVIT